MAFALGNKAIRRLCVDQDPLKWHRAKLSAVLFKPYEQPVFEYVVEHLKMHHALPQVVTLEAAFPDIAQLDTPEPSSYYVTLLENQFFYDRIGKVTVDVNTLLKENQDGHEEALQLLQGATKDIAEQKYRQQILDVGKEAGPLVLKAYHYKAEHSAIFGWPYLDHQSGGAMPGEVISVVGRPAAGKAQPLDAQVLTRFDGFKRMGDIQEGDVLASIDGGDSCVTGVFPQGQRPIYLVMFQDGRNTEVSDEHLWEVFYRQWDSPRVLTTLQLIAKLKAKRYRNRLSIRLFDGQCGQPITSKFSPYLLGCLLGDGGFTARDYIRFTSADESLVKRLNHELHMEGLTLKYMDRYDYSIKDERQPSQDRMKQWIIDLKLRFHRSEEKFIPDIYLQADFATRLELLRGLMDTDGTAEVTGGVSFSSSSRVLAEQVVYLVRSLGGKAKISDNPTDCLPHYRVSIVMKERGLIFDLDRKRQRVNFARTTHTNHRLVIESISYVGEKDCQCLSVSHPSQLYLTDDFVVTHNTWKMLWIAMKNWMTLQENTLFVSMEMMTLPIAQRITALYTKQNISQLKVSGYSTQTFQKFYAGLKCMATEKAKFYVIDGNLAASAEDIFLLASLLECKLIFIDGAYLLRHRNGRLDRFTRAAENVELIKRACTDLNTTAFCSWQFNRVASEKQKKGGHEKAGLEDIGYSDAIGQISSIVLGLFQEDSVETMMERKVRVLKGRNGEVGQFTIAWDFASMNFDQTDPSIAGETEKQHDLQWV